MLVGSGDDFVVLIASTTRCQPELRASPPEAPEFTLGRRVVR
jgi:hypothetical protein